MQQRANSRDQGPRPTRLVAKRERPGGHPVFQNIGAGGAAKDFLRCSLPGGWTDSRPDSWIYALCPLLSVIASTPPPMGARDGTQGNNEQVAMSHAALAGSSCAAARERRQRASPPPPSPPDRPPGSVSGDHQPTRGRRAA